MRKPYSENAPQQICCSMDYLFLYALLIDRWICKIELTYVSGGKYFFLKQCRKSSDSCARLGVYNKKCDPKHCLPSVLANYFDGFNGKKKLGVKSH